MQGPFYLLLYFEFLEYSLFHNQHPNEGGEDAQADINDVMMTRIDGCPPDAQADESEEQDGRPSLVAEYGIDGGYEHIGCMQAWYGSKYVGILAIQAVENLSASQLIPSSETCYIAWGVENWLKTIIHRIPRWGCWMNVVADETYEVDHQECP